MKEMRLKNSDDCSTLDDVRLAIDAIDLEIVRLVAQRWQYVIRAASFKTSLTAVEAKERVAQVLNTRRAWAEELGVSSELVGELFQNMIKRFIAGESEQWKRHNILGDEEK